MRANRLGVIVGVDEFVDEEDFFRLTSVLPEGETMIDCGGEGERDGGSGEARADS